MIRSRAPQAATAGFGRLGFLALAAFALFTATYDAALLLALSLQAVMAIWLGLVALLLAGQWARPGRPIPDPISGRHGWPLAGLALVAALVPLLTNRPDADDSFYLSRAVLDWENWNAPIARLYPFAFVDGAGGIFPSLPAYEHLLAGLAGLAGLRPITLYHCLAPALGGLIPLAWFRCLRRLDLAAGAALAGCAAIVVLMLLDGSTHRGIANFSLLRIWQGKVILISVFTPLALIAVLDAIEHGRPRDFLLLLLLGVAGLGLSTTAAFYLPILVGVAGIAHAIAWPSRHAFGSAVLAAIAVFLYPALCVLPLYANLVGPGAIFATPIAQDAAATGALVYGGWLGATPLAALAGLLGLAVARRFRQLAWLLLWTAAIVLPLAIPRSAALISHYATTADALWRLAYACPVILAVGLGIGALGELPWFRRPLRVALGAAAAMTVALAVLQLPPSPFAGDVRFPFLGTKLPAADLAAGAALTRDLPPGRMLAPRPLSVVLPLLGARLRMANFREFDAAPQLVLNGQRDLADDLTQAHDYVSGLATGAAAAAALGRIAGRLDYVVLAPEMPDHPTAAAALAALGYHPLAMAAGSYQAFRRRP